MQSEDQIKKDLNNLTNNGKNVKDIFTNKTADLKKFKNLI